MGSKTIFFWCLLSPELVRVWGLRDAHRGDVRVMVAVYPGGPHHYCLHRLRLQEEKYLTFLGKPLLREATRGEKHLNWRHCP